jgi:hypothetical protein
VHSIQASFVSAGFKAGLQLHEMTSQDVITAKLQEDGACVPAWRSFTAHGHALPPSPFHPFACPRAMLLLLLLLLH